jgi:dienelactone hydrolase
VRTAALAPMTRRRLLECGAISTLVERVAFAQACVANPSGPRNPLPGFDEIECYAAGLKHRLYRMGQGPAVFVCHELPGLYDADINLARRIASRGYTAYVPLFFGSPGDNRTVANAVSLCLNPWSSFTCWRSRTSPTAHWMEPLLNGALVSCGGKGIGVIGMCLTGSFALAAMRSPALRAAVLCQPTMPLIGSSRLDLSPDEVMDAGSSQVEILALKFSADPKSPDPRWKTMRNLFGARMTELVVDSRPINHHGVAHDAHSILAGSYNDAFGTPTREAFERVIRFIDNRLSEHPTTPPFPQPGERCPPGFTIFGNEPCS